MEQQRAVNAELNYLVDNMQCESDTNFVIGRLREEKALVLSKETQFQAQRLKCVIAMKKILRERDDNVANVRHPNYGKYTDEIIRENTNLNDKEKGVLLEWLENVGDDIELYQRMEEYFRDNSMGLDSGSQVYNILYTHSSKL